VELSFANRHLQQAYEQEAVGARTWGRATGQQYGVALSIILAARDITALYAYRPFRFHPLRGNRAGQFSIALGGRWRLIVTVQGATVTIEEVSRHYDD
jgi:plasmid maintenance system killer protein